MTLILYNPRGLAIVREWPLCTPSVTSLRQASIYSKHSGSRALMTSTFPPISLSRLHPLPRHWRINAIHVPVSAFSTSRSRTGTRNYGKHTRWILGLSLSGLVAVSTALYAEATLRNPKNSTIHTTYSEPVTGNKSPLVSQGLHEISEDESLDASKLPVEEAKLTSAPNVPPRITRDYPVLLQVHLTTFPKLSQLTSTYKYEQWTFNGLVPGPFIRARVGDVVELTLTNKDETGNPHNVDCHAFIGPGGGASLTTAEENETKTGRFRLLYPGLYLYHCAAAPVPVHIANGMYGLIYVQPEEGDVPSVDREFYVMQSEFYHEPPEVLETGRRSSVVEFSYPNMLREDADVVVFNGNESALTRDHPLKAETNETVRIFFGNAGPNLTSSLHVLGGNFMNVFRDGGVANPPAKFLQTVSVPPGSATIVDMKMHVPGTYTLVDHAISRLDKGAVGYLNVSGKPRPDIYQSTEPPAPCVGCKLHP